MPLWLDFDARSGWSGWWLQHAGKENDMLNVEPELFPTAETL